jgi:hypothetical protein
MFDAKWGWIWVKIGEVSKKVGLVLAEVGLD